MLSRIEEQDITIPELEDAPAPRTFWTERDIAILRKYYGKKPTTRIAKVLHRSATSVRLKALALGLGFK